MNIQIDNLQAITNLADKYPAAAESAVDKAIRSAFLRVLGYIKTADGAPVGVNNMLRDQWTQSLARFYGKLESSTPYASDVEFGTNPHWIPWKSIDFQKWAAKKGLNAFLVARSISIKGTKANPFFERSVQSVTDGINQDFTTCLDNIVKGIT